MPNDPMKRFALLVLALAGMPLAWGLARAFWDGLLAGMAAGVALTPGWVGFLGGAAAMVALYAWQGKRMMVLYVFAHEMTHAAVGLLFGARIHRVSVSETGGFVELSKSNLAITLAPYCVPFYLLVALGLCAAVAWAWPGAVPWAAWATLFGFLTLFHVLYTVDTLISVAQPDVREYGRVFSYWFIVATNYAFASLALVLAGQAHPAAQARRVARRTEAAYAASARWLSVPVRFVLERSQRP